MQLKIAISPRTVVKYLLIGVVFFTLISTAIQICKYVFDYRDEWMDLFNLDRELNLPTWYSALMLGFCSLLLRIIAVGKKQQGDRFTKDWQLLSLIFFGLAIDEVLSIHEVLIIPEVSEALNLPWFLHSMWVIPGVVFVVWFGKRYSKFVRCLPPKSKQHFVVAACTYIGGALVMEMVGSHFAESQGQQHLPYALIATAEEVLEMIGIVIFLYALFYYLSKWTEQLDLQISVGDPISDRKSRCSKT
ncbi:hypothetical protein IQ255_22065 [Pleurocapsales cyanobacterium LEGE 10410]|nr:hypothetical protein [Pleurocapsales cyanobacterium LEGE 10410]